MVQARQVSVGFEYACAVLKTGKLACWGNNANGKLGDGTTAKRATPVEVALGEGNSAVAVIARSNHTCAILGDNTVKCWGANNLGQLGDGSRTRRDGPVAVDLGESRTARILRAGWNHTCALLDDNSVKCWGHNLYGQLGDGSATTSVMTTPVAVNLGDDKAIAIAAGGESSCALLEDNSLKCWGRNNYGQLGDGTTTHRDGAPIATTLPDGKSAMAVSIGVENACAILDDNSLACWGRNEEGQLGVDTSSNETCTVSSVDYDCVKTPTMVDLGAGRTAMAVTAGNTHTCALLDDNSVACWGQNNYGQLGDGTIVDKSTPTTTVDLGDKTVAAIRCRGKIAPAPYLKTAPSPAGETMSTGSWGRGRAASRFSHPLTVDTGDETVTAIDGGSGHSCGLFEDEDDPMSA